MTPRSRYGSDFNGRAEIIMIKTLGDLSGESEKCFNKKKIKFLDEIFKSIKCYFKILLHLFNFMI